MKISNIILVALLGITSQSAFATGETVGSDKVSIENLASIDCRAGEEYWENNKGLYISLQESFAYSYRKNGHEQGDQEVIQCSANGNRIVCQGNRFVLTIPNISKTAVQISGDLGDALGSLVGVPTKRVEVVKGTLEAEGVIFDSEKPVVCAVD